MTLAQSCAKSPSRKAAWGKTEQCEGGNVKVNLKTLSDSPPDFPARPLAGRSTAMTT